MRPRIISTLVGAATFGGALGVVVARPPSTDIDPNLYVNALDTTVAYDDLLNTRDYDDGYQPDAWKPFEAALAPHGTWVDSDRLGRVWFPSPDEVGPTFVPYSTRGHWALTEHGWTWISDWRWGWAPFHYGRWAVLPGQGWCWIPGTIWGPAWVAWRAGRNYVAWAPLPPEGVSIGRPLGPRSPWTMVRAETLGTPHPSYIPPRVLPSFFGRTTAFSNPTPMTLGPYTVEVNEGPTNLRCCRGRVRRHLAEIAPDLLPGDRVRPLSGAVLDSRPWVQHGFGDQTPICEWPADGTRDAGPCLLSAAAPSATGGPASSRNHP
jgi:hypothetical protein